jgi:hypothetical protein
VLGGVCVVDGQNVDGSHYRASSYSGSGNCVEVDLARSDALVAVRHSRRPDDPPLLFNRDEWLAFVAGVQNHEFDLE